MKYLLLTAGSCAVTYTLGMIAASLGMEVLILYIYLVILFIGLVIVVCFIGETAMKENNSDITREDIDKAVDAISLDSSLSVDEKEQRIEDLLARNGLLIDYNSENN